MLARGDNEQGECARLIWKNIKRIKLALNNIKQ
jgi:hypothetical protein